MSDLQCPATFLVVGVNTLGEGWHGEVAGLAERLRDRRVAAVYGRTAAPAAAVAAALAGGLGLPSHTLAEPPTPPGDRPDGAAPGPARGGRRTGRSPWSSTGTDGAWSTAPARGRTTSADDGGGRPAAVA